MIIWLIWLGVLVLIILAGYWYESTPWRYCKRCGHYWNVKSGKTQNYCPRECDGIVRIADCPGCEKEVSL